MKTLSHLIQEAEERFAKKLELREDKGGFTYLYEGRDELSSEAIKNFLKTELTNIVKESFKNARVEEKEMLENDEKSIWTINETRQLYNSALSDKQEKENRFLNN